MVVARNMSRFSILSLSLVGLVSSCAGPGTEDCAEGFARDNQGRCQPIARAENAADTGLIPHNTPPTAPAISLAPQTPREHGRPLVCTIQTASIDTDNDDVSYAITWTKNGEKVGQGDTTHWPGDTLPGTALVEGDVWECTVIPSDGQTTGPSTSATVSIGSGFEGWDEQIMSIGEADYAIVGEPTGRAMGSAIAPAGDLDQDGKADFIVADDWWEHPEQGLNAGKVYVFLGADLGADPHFSAAESAWSIEGEFGQRDHDSDCDPDEPSERCGGDRVGHSLAGGMDGDGDGVEDLLICAYRSNDQGVDRGKIGFFSGGHLGERGGLSIADADVSIYGEMAGDMLGHSVNWAGDVDGDGVADLVTGSHLHSPNGVQAAGRTYLMLSGPLESGEDLYMPDAADYIWDGEFAEDESGKRTVYAGDIDGDGMADIATAALRNQDNGVGDDITGERRGSGKFYIIMSSDIHATSRGSILNLGDVGMAWMGEFGGDALGYGVDSMGDFDGDGLDDLSAGSFGNSENAFYAGKSYVITSADMPEDGIRSVAEASYNFIGESKNDWSGMGVGPAGDLDRDGQTDLLIGAMGHSTDANEQVGRTYLFYAQNVEPGSHSVNAADHIIEGENAWDQSGYRMAAPGDVNGDGMPDLLITAWQGDSPGQPGKLYVMLSP